MSDGPAEDLTPGHNGEEQSGEAGNTEAKGIGLTFEEDCDPLVERYMRVSKYYSVLIMQSFIVLLNIVAPVPDGWTKSGLFVEWSDVRGEIWSLIMAVTSYTSFLIGVLLTFDLPRFPGSGPDRYEGVFLGFLQFPWIAIVGIILLRSAGINPEYLLLTFTLATFLMIGLVPKSFFEKGPLERIVFRHWVGLAFLVLSSAVTWHLLWSSILPDGLKQYLPGLERAKVKFFEFFELLERIWNHPEILVDTVGVGSETNTDLGVFGVVLFVIVIVAPIVLSLALVGVPIWQHRDEIRAQIDLLYERLTDRSNKYDYWLGGKHPVDRLLDLGFIFYCCFAFCFVLVLPGLTLVLIRLGSHELKVSVAKCGTTFLFILLINAVLDVFVWG